MSKTIADSRQIEHRTTLPRVSSEQFPTLKQALPQIDKELTPLFELRESSTPNLILNVGAGKLQNSDTLLSRAFSPIKKKYFSFTSGTIEFPSTSGGNITVTPGVNSVLNVSAGNYIVCLIQINYLGQLSIVTGIEAASAALAESAANFPKHKSGLLPIGYVTIYNDGGTIQNITNAEIVQFAAGGGGGAGADVDGEMILANNQTTPADITDFIVEPVDGEHAKVDYSVTRKNDGVDIAASFDGPVLGITGNVELEADTAGTIGNSILIEPNIGAGTKAFYSGPVSGVTGTVELEANYEGTIGNSIELSTPLLDDSFNNNAVNSNKFSNGIVNAIVADAGIFIGGTFTNYLNTGRDYFVQLTQDGQLDTAFCTNATDGSKFNSTVYAIAVQYDYSILVGGDFTDYKLPLNRDYFIRLLADGNLDTAFCANASDGSQFDNTVHTIVVQPDDKILVGGEFTNYKAPGRNGLIRLNSDGTLDTAFCANASDSGKFNNAVRSIKLQPDGKIIVGGTFNNYINAGRNNLVRLNADGTLDTVFCTNATDGGKFNNDIYTVERQIDGKILAGGIFTDYNLTTGRDRLIRLNSDGTVDSTFCINAIDNKITNNYVLSILSQIDNRVVIGGRFDNYAGITGLNNLIRVNQDGTLDTSFTDNYVKGTYSAFSNMVASIEDDMVSTGRMFIGGGFLHYDISTNVATNLNRLIATNATKSLAFLSAEWNFDNPSNEVTVNSSLNVIPSPTTVISLSGGTDGTNDSLTTAVNTWNVANPTNTVTLLSANGSDILQEDIQLTGGGTSSPVYLRETGSFYLQYNEDTTDWEIKGETFAGDEAGIEFSVDGNQVQYTTTNIAGTLVKSILKFFCKYL